MEHLLNTAWSNPFTRGEKIRFHLVSEQFARHYGSFTWFSVLIRLLLYRTNTSLSFELCIKIGELVLSK